MELYLHLPFCHSKCRYCDFASYPGRETEIQRYIICLIRELHTYPAGTPIDTVFIGGGTPSLVPPELMDKLLCAIRTHFVFNPGCEFTCECNPGTLTPEFLQILRRHGCNRLSMGAQAKQPELLKTLGRIHTWEEVEASFALARQAGFKNLSLDLMFGLPGQTLPQWEETLQAALTLKPEHLSCYGLIVEDGTPFYAMEQAGQLNLPDEDTERAMYDTMLTLCAQNGMLPYEISNLSKPGYECRHNLGYWQQVPYIGLGAAAHSLLPCAKEKGAYLRQGNTPDLTAYMQGIESGRPVLSEQAYISHEDAQFETWMLGLRTAQGVKATAADMTRYGAILNTLIQQNLLEYTDGFYRLTRRGMDVQNAVLVELMEV